MSLVQVELISEMGESIIIPLNDPSQGYYIYDIEGLDPVKADIVTSSFGATDDDVYQAARRGSRNIVFKLRYNPDYLTTNVRDLRRALYRKLMPKSEIRMRFTTWDMNVVEIQGRVETFVHPLFVRKPESEISVICVKSDFYDLDTIRIDGNTVTGTADLTHTYDGDVPSGVLFKLNVNRDINDFKLLIRGLNGVTKTLEFAYPLVAGDVVEINTQPREKGAYLVRAGTRQSVLYGVSPVSDWVNLTPGANYIRVVTAGAAVPYTIDYVTKYGGL